MKRSHILKLMELSFITPEDALLLRDKLSEFEITENNWFAKTKKLIDNAIDKETDDFTAFKLQFIKNNLLIINKDSIDLNEKKVDVGYSVDNDDRLSYLSEKEKEKNRKAEEYLNSKAEEELVVEAVDFILKTYPNVLIENNRFLLDQAYKKFLKKIDVIHFYYLSEEPANKLRMVNQEIDNEISKRKYEFEKNNVNKYLTDYLIWAKINNINKHTKQNIQLYLKQNGIKLMNPTIDLLKNLTETM